MAILHDMEGHLEKAFDVATELLRSSEQEMQALEGPDRKQVLTDLVCLKCDIAKFAAKIPSKDSESRVMAHQVFSS